ncbi:MAG: 4-hydroxy-tetrahydrodipicolinate synthase [Gammaproteobacteria bacterium]|nr:4-hydroxy-tetrahydrodipicolinate synthase [Gammaproteobacteria bacterium]
MFQGSFVALVTPMAATGEIDFAALERLLDYHVEQGSDGIVAVGTTGESATLDQAEHCEVIARVVKHLAGRLPVFAGTGANSTREAIELTRCAAEAGADAALLVTPYYNKPTQEGLFLHHKAIAEAVSIPQILYNVPARTGCDMITATVLRLAAIDNIIGLKDATADLARARELLEQRPDGFMLYSGDDDTAMELILNGGDGVISVTANVAPRAMRDVAAAALKGDRSSAEALNGKLAELHQKLFVESNPIPVKWGVEQLGLIGPGIRLPMTPLSPEYHDTVRSAMDKAGLI